MKITFRGKGCAWERDWPMPPRMGEEIVLEGVYFVVAKVNWADSVAYKGKDEDGKEQWLIFHDAPDVIVWLEEA